MREAIDDGYMGVRRFLPGNCGSEGDSAQLFAELDSQAKAPLPELVAAACGSCLVRRDCESQRDKIANTLHALGVAVPIVAGMAVTAKEGVVRYMTERERLSLAPRHEFDISGPLPESPLTAATLLRQWAVVQGRLLMGAPSRASRELALEAASDPACRKAIDGTNLTDDEVHGVLLVLSKLLIGHERQDRSKSTWGRRESRDQLDMSSYMGMAPLYLAEASEVKGLGYEDLGIAFYHSADFWRRVLKAYEDSNCIKQSSVIFHCEHSKANPIPQIERQVSLNDARRRGTYNNPYTIPVAVRRSHIERLSAQLADSHPYITEAMIVKAFSTSTTVDAALEKVGQLQRPEIAEVAINYRDKLSAEALQYCLMHTEGPELAIRKYLQRVKDLTSCVQSDGGEVAPSYIEQIAIDPKSAQMSGEQIVVEAETKSMGSMLRLKCKENGITRRVPAWAVRQIVMVYPKEEWWEVISSLNELIDTDILRPQFLSCAMETEAANVDGYMKNAVGKKGQYITFTMEAIRGLPDERARAAIVQAANLDLLVYGRRLPEPATESYAELPVWLRPDELDVLAELAKKGDVAKLVLDGIRPVPNALLVRYGSDSAAMSAIKVAVLKGNAAKRLHQRAGRRTFIREHVM